MSNITEH